MDVASLGTLLDDKDGARLGTLLGDKDVVRLGTLLPNNDCGVRLVVLQRWYKS